jgi:hypothetical protein
MSGKIFLNYRREDEWGVALALFGHLEQSLPPDRLFMDVEGGIRAGQDFVRVLEDQVSGCDVMLVLIGLKWLTGTDQMGRRRLDNPQDFVRIEIESALRLGKWVIPVLVHTTQMPRADELPETLKPLARRNAVRLTKERFKADAQGLIDELKRRASGDGDSEAAGSFVKEDDLPPPSITAALNQAAMTIDDYQVACSVTVTNTTGQFLQEKCLVKLLEMSSSWPDGMPHDFILRTENQIRSRRSGRFNLAVAEQKYALSGPCWHPGPK